MNREQNPATEKQVTLIRDLGLTVPPECSVAQAADIITLAQIVRQFAIQIARQEWRQDISSYDLRPLIRSILWTPEMADEIHEIMDAHIQAAWSAQDDQERSTKDEKPMPESGTPNVTHDLREDSNYTIVKAKLEYYFAELKTMSPKLAASLPPKPTVFLASDSGVLSSVRNWVDGLRKK